MSLLKIPRGVDLALLASKKKKKKGKRKKKASTNLNN